MSFETVDVPTRCSNLNCRNEVGTGHFELLRLGGRAQEFSVMVLLCAPCSKAVKDA